MSITSWTVTRPRTAPRLLIHTIQGTHAHAPDWQQYPGTHRSNHAANHAPGPLLPPPDPATVTVGPYTIDTATPWRHHHAGHKPRLILRLHQAGPPIYIITSPDGETYPPTAYPERTIKRIADPLRLRIRSDDPDAPKTVAVPEQPLAERLHLTITPANP